MLSYTLKRLLALIPVLAVVSVVIFALIHLTPGNPARAILGPEASAADVEALSERLGLNRPVALQYVEWLGRAVTGNFGDSLFLRKSVTQAVAPRNSRSRRWWWPSPSRCRWARLRRAGADHHWTPWPWASRSSAWRCPASFSV
jgi:ABC-type microcin C transport system permease subunit YejB